MDYALDQLDQVADRLILVVQCLRPRSKIHPVPGRGRWQVALLDSFASID